jgi:N-formylglutamate amidohydrolase
MRKQPFTVTMPALRSTPVVFASPHSGRDYPWGMLNLSHLDERQIRSSEDAYVDLLFQNAPDAGAPLIAGRVPRAYVDFNRGSDELDPALIEGVGKGAAGRNPRIASGLGVSPRVVAGSREIYRGKLTHEEADRRIRDCWEPYHARLGGLLRESLALFGEAVLVDCHSMPHEAIETLCGGRGPLPEVVLGDRYGAAASGEIVDRIEAAFIAAGFRVARNKPFAGAYVARQYGRPAENQHVVQVEIDRALYLNEQLVRPNGNFLSVQSSIASVVIQIAGADSKKMPLAAE